MLYIPLELTVDFSNSFLQYVVQSFSSRRVDKYRNPHFDLMLNNSTDLFPYDNSVKVDAIAVQLNIMLKFYYGTAKNLK